VTLSDEQAAAARAAAGPDGRVKVRQAGTDVIREINVNPPTEETVEETVEETLPAPTPDPTGFDWGWASGVAESAEKKSVEAKPDKAAEKLKWERRLEFFEASLRDEQNKRKRGGSLRGRETAREKELKAYILKANEALKNL
jgi:hypothetical protein